MLTLNKNVAFWHDGVKVPLRNLLNLTQACCWDVWLFIFLSGRTHSWLCVSAVL